MPWLLLLGTLLIGTWMTNSFKARIAILEQDNAVLREQLALLNKNVAVLEERLAQRVEIGGLLPDPPGLDEENEEVIIANMGKVAVNFVGWKLKDRSGRTWSLDDLGTLPPGTWDRFQRKGGSMWLNQDGDTIRLVDPTGRVVHTFTYQSAQEGEWVGKAPPKDE